MLPRRNFTPGTPAISCCEGEGEGEGEGEDEKEKENEPLPLEAERATVYGKHRNHGRPSAGCCAIIPGRSGFEHVGSGLFLI
jgi:hypothetical protein